jgi:hypothetical protein
LIKNHYFFERVLNTLNSTFSNHQIADNIDTRTALDVVRELVSQSNVYIRDRKTKLNSLLLRKIAAYITDLLHTFGAISGPRGGIGFPMGGSSSGDVSFEVFFSAFPSKMEFLSHSWRPPSCPT